MAQHVLPQAWLTILKTWEHNHLSVHVKHCSTRWAPAKNYRKSNGFATTTQRGSSLAVLLNLFQITAKTLLLHSDVNANYDIWPYRPCFRYFQNCKSGLDMMSIYATVYSEWMEKVIRSWKHRIWLFFSECDNILIIVIYIFVLTVQQS